MLDYGIVTKRCIVSFLSNSSFLGCIWQVWIYESSYCGSYSSTQLGLNSCLNPVYCAMEKDHRGNRNQRSTVDKSSWLTCTSISSSPFRSVSSSIIALGRVSILRISLKISYSAIKLPRHYFGGISWATWSPVSSASCLWLIISTPWSRASRGSCFQPLLERTYHWFLLIIRSAPLMHWEYWSRFYRSSLTIDGFHLLPISPEYLLFYRFEERLSFGFLDNELLRVSVQTIIWYILYAGLC